MIVVAIIGILAAVAIPGFMQYIKNSKTSEAKTNINSVTKGALSYFEEEHVDADGMGASTKKYPEGSATMGTSADASTIGKKTAITASAGSTGSAVWSKLKVNVTAPIYYYYNYTGTTTSGRSRFQISATASLSSAKDSLFCMNGNADGELSALITSDTGADVTVGSITCKANTATPVAFNE